MPGRPAGIPLDLVRELYAAENAGLAEPSGSQDMCGLIFPGVSRLDYDAASRAAGSPATSNRRCDPGVARWLERVIHLVPVAPRPPGYGPLGVKRLDPEWVRRLGQSGRTATTRSSAQDLDALGASLNECSRCWDALLPHTLAHPTIQIDLKGLLAAYEARYPGAMYSGCGGGYLVVASEEEVPGSFQVTVRTGRAPDDRHATSRRRARRGAIRVVVQASLDNLHSAQVRFLQEAARLGPVHVRVPSDPLVESGPAGHPASRRRSGSSWPAHCAPWTTAALVRRPLARAVPDLAPRFDALVVPAAEDDPDLRARCGRARPASTSVIGAGRPARGSRRSTMTARRSRAAAAGSS